MRYKNLPHSKGDTVSMGVAQRSRQGGLTDGQAQTVLVGMRTSKNESKTRGDSRGVHSPRSRLVRDFRRGDAARILD